MLDPAFIRVIPAEEAVVTAEAGVQLLHRPECALLNVTAGHILMRMRPRSVIADRDEHLHPALRRLIHQRGDGVGAAEVFGKRIDVGLEISLGIVLIDEAGAKEHDIFHIERFHLAYLFAPLFL